MTRFNQTKAPPPAARDLSDRPGDGPREAGASSSCQKRKNPSLIAADLMEVDVVEAGVDIRPRLLDVGQRLRPEGHGLGEVVGRDVLRRLLEMRRSGSSCDRSP